MTVYPASPFASFDWLRHECFQCLYQRYAEPRLISLKEQVFCCLEAASAPPSDPLSRFDRDQRACVRVALRQWGRLKGASAVLAAWRRVFEAHGNDEH